MNKVYVTNPKVNILYKNRFVLSSADIVEAMNYANRALKELSDTTMKFDINIFETLGMRNLSGMIGEYFARSVAKVSDGKLVSNLHQDGYPDLLLVDTPVKKKYLERRQKISCRQRTFQPVQVWRHRSEGDLWKHTVSIES